MLPARSLIGTSLMANGLAAASLLSATAALAAPQASGDVPAIKLLLSYTVGKPRDTPDLDTLDQHELQTHLANHAATTDTLLRIVQGMPAEQAIDRTQGGLGVGLTLVRRLVELHGGRVTAESRGRGRGSTFTVTLPAAES